jgi:hypothetical protein
MIQDVEIDQQLEDVKSMKENSKRSEVLQGTHGL